MTTIVADKTNLRLRMACPHCSGHTRIRTSRLVTATYRQLYLVCGDPACGFSMAADLTITHGLSPSGKPNPACHLPMAQPRKRPTPANDDMPVQHSGPEVPPIAANEDADAGEAIG